MSKRKKDGKSAHGHSSHEIQDGEIFKFPDNIILMIFANLDTESLIAASKVCRKWFHLSKDASLWTRLDFRRRAKALSLKSLWKLSRARFTTSLKELHLRGSIGPSKAILDSITIPFLDDLKLRSPTLTALSLEYFDLRMNKLSVSALPSQLSYLSLKDSMLSHGWFDSLKNNTFCMNKLTTLDLSNCTIIGNTDLEALSYLKSIRVLLLYNCYRISARGIPTIAANLRDLTRLDVSCCPGINDVALHYFGRHSHDLKQLSLRFCHHITDGGIASLVYGARDLEHLDIFSCHEVTGQSLKNIEQYSKKLKSLDIRSCKMSQREAEDFAASVPSCRVIFGAQSMGEGHHAPSCVHAHQH